MSCTLRSLCTKLSPLVSFAVTTTVRAPPSSASAARWCSRSSSHLTSTAKATLPVRHLPFSLGQIGSRAASARTQAFSTRTQALPVFTLLPAKMFGLAAGTVGYNVALSAIIAVGTNSVGFIIAMLTKTHKITDLIGCGTFAVSAWATQIAAMNGNKLDVFSYKKPLFLTIAVTFWSVRLGGFLFYRVLQTGTDKRLDQFYSSEGEPWLTGPAKYPLKLLGFWFVQAVWGFSVVLPVTVAQAAKPAAQMGPWGWIGFVLFMSFWAYEATADFQKDYFKKKPENKGNFCSTGLYQYCQFPNYFAEICCWWSMFFWAGFPSVFVPHGYIIVSPIVTTLLLRWGSGVANLKKGQEERYGDRQDYRDYCASTPLLFPFMKPFYKDQSAPEQLVQGDSDGTLADQGDSAQSAK